MFSGRVTRSAFDQIEDLARSAEPSVPDEPQSDGAQFAVDPQELVLFANSRKTEPGSKLPDYWGYCNPGNGQPLLRLSIWAKTDRNGKAMLTGSATVHTPAKEMQAERQRRRARAR